MRDAPSRRSPDWLARGASTYRSEIESTDARSGVTTFFHDHARSLTGAYSFTVNGGIVVGRLSRCRVAGEREVRCRWRDRYGAGTLCVGFSSDFSSFEGRWTREGEADEYAWNGQLVEANPCATGPRAFVEPREPATH